MLVVKRILFAHFTQVISIALYRFWIILSEKMQDLREANSTSRPSELERQLRDFQRQLRDAQQREENLQRQFRELQEREQSSQRQLTESRQREQNL